MCHQYDDAEELSVVISVDSRVEPRDESDIRLYEGEFVTVPSDVAHRPVAGNDAAILLVEPSETRTRQMRTVVPPNRNSKELGKLFPPGATPLAFYLASSAQGSFIRESRLAVPGSRS